MDTALVFITQIKSPYKPHVSILVYMLEKILEGDVFTKRMCIDVEIMTRIQCWNVIIIIIIIMSIINVIWTIIKNKLMMWIRHVWIIKPLLEFISQYIHQTIHIYRKRNGNPSELCHMIYFKMFLSISKFA